MLNTASAEHHTSEAPPIWTPPEALRLGVLRLTLVPSQMLQLPALDKGSVLRGALGYALKDSVCFQADRRACTPCTLGNLCPYGYLYETRPPEDDIAAGTQQDVPHPFVLQPPLSRRTLYQPGQPLRFDLVLVGRGIRYLPYFLEAFRRLGRRGMGRGRARFELSSAEMVHPLTGAATPVYGEEVDAASARDRSIGYAEVEAAAAAMPSGEIVVDFLSPARLKHRSQYVRPVFPVLIRRLLDRLECLSSHHCGREWRTDFRGIVAAAERVESFIEVRKVDRQRYSTRQQQSMNLYGFVGRATYRGDLVPFRPLLALGELLHVGKAVTFGNGRYAIHGWRRDDLAE
jgi:hypothetical protein